jgi:hypothetical protein
MYARKVDSNHGEVVNALRKVGASVQSLAKVGGGCPDLAVGFNGVNYLLEVKDGKAGDKRQRQPNSLQREWYMHWQGRVDVVTSVEEALAIIGATQPQWP